MVPFSPTGKWWCGACARRTAVCACPWQGPICARQARSNRFRQKVFLLFFVIDIFFLLQTNTHDRVFIFGGWGPSRHRSMGDADHFNSDGDTGWNSDCIVLDCAALADKTVTWVWPQITVRTGFLCSLIHGTHHFGCPLCRRLAHCPLPYLLFRVQDPPRALHMLSAVLVVGPSWLGAALGYCSMIQSS